MHERSVRSHDLPHPLLHALKFIISYEIDLRATVFQWNLLTDFAIQSARKRVIYRQDLVGIHFTHNFLQDETEGPDICPSAVRVVISDEKHIMRIDYPVVKGLQPVIYERSQYRSLTRKSFAPGTQLSVQLS